MAQITFSFHSYISTLRYPPPRGAVSTAQTSWSQEEKEKVGGGRRGRPGAGGSPVDYWNRWAADDKISLYFKVILVLKVFTLLSKVIPTPAGGAAGSAGPHGGSSIRLVCVCLHLWSGNRQDNSSLLFLVTKWECVSWRPAWDWQPWLPILQQGGLRMV